jgi:hypothetical protein
MTGTCNSEAPLHRPAGGLPRSGDVAARVRWSPMARTPPTKWFRLRLVLGVGVLALLAVDLSDHWRWPVLLAQDLLIAGVVVTSLLDLREVRVRRAAAPGAPSA